MTPAEFDKIVVARDASGNPLVAVLLVFVPSQYSYAVIAWMPGHGWQKTCFNLSRHCDDPVDALQRAAHRILGSSPELGQSHRIHSYQIIEPPGEQSAGEPRGGWLLTQPEGPQPQAPERAGIAPA